MENTYANNAEFLTKILTIAKTPKIRTQIIKCWKAIQRKRSQSGKKPATSASAVSTTRPTPKQDDFPEPTDASSTCSYIYFSGCRV